MNRRDIVFGVVIVAAIGGLIYFFSRPEEDLKVPEPQTLSVEDKIEESFNLEIPEDVDKAELKDVSGGGSSAIATRNLEGGVFVHTILADLPDPEAGNYYQGWLVKEGEEDKAIPTGRFSMAKGGYLLEFSSQTDYSDYKEVVVTKKTTSGKLPKDHILKGNFN